MRILLLIFLLMNMSRPLQAAEDWAYCDSNKRAWLNETREVPDCPMKSSRPGQPAMLPEFQDPFDCPTKTTTIAVNHGELDYICAYPTAAESGDDETRNTNRCINADKKHCQLDAGGISGPGAHTIPSLGWYHQTGATLVFPDIRCQCGCFIGETLITSVSGRERIDLLAELSKAMPVGIMQISLAKEQTFSQPLRGHDFTVGPEEKPVIRITTKTGAILTVTDIHPILVSRDGIESMLQAKSLASGDSLIDENGRIDEVLTLESYKLDPLANKVYNLDTRAVAPEDHVISANNILVGDLYWQKRLSEELNRVENILASANITKD